MKQTLLITLISFALSSFVIASADTFTDKLAVIGSPGLSSDPCAAIDKKIMKLDRFTEVVQNTSAFHLEEKASALPVPGITVSNNKKKMLRDAKKKYAEYAAERQKYGCENSMPAGTDQIAVVAKPTQLEVERQKNTVETPMTSSTDKMAVVGSPGLSSDQCAAIDKKVLKLDRFTEVVQNTSAFHLEEKATALPVPGITVSNNKKKMLRDAKKKYAEYAAERQKYGCDTPMTSSTDKKAVVSKPALSSAPSATIDKKPVKQDKVTTKVNNSSTTVHVEAKAAALPVPASTVSNKKEQMSKSEEKRAKTIEVEHPKYVTETPAPVTTSKTVEKKAVVSKPVLSSNSSDSCAAIDKKLIKLYQFTIMVNNTSAFHLEEKASALSVPGITVSNNKKKMLRDAEKKGKELLEERQKYGCDTTEQ
jgi:virulence-associated protein VapD